MIGHLDSWKLHIQLSWVSQPAGESGSSRNYRAGQVYIGAGSAGSTHKIAVAGADGDGVGARGHAVSNAKSAGRFQYSGPECYQVAEGAIFGNGIQDLSRSGGDS